jgi:hypothetical protein
MELTKRRRMRTLAARSQSPRDFDGELRDVPRLNPDN